MIKLPVSDFSKLVHDLYAQGEQNIKPGLERMQALLPHWCFSCVSTIHVHIAGTNGKGSTAFYLYQILRAYGLKVGLYTSPHLDCITERIRVGDVQETVISRDDFVAIHQKLEKVCEQVGIKLSFFETLTALAMDWIASQPLDVCIWEVGLGGRWDATNVVDASYSAITNIGLDHQEYLGYSLEEILREKAGILKPKQQMISMVDATLRPLLNDIARKVGADVRYVDVKEEVSFEHRNKRLALALAQKMGYEVRNDCLEHLLPWPGRMEWINPHLCLDGAHNSAGMYALAQEIRNIKPSLRLVLGVMKRKEYSALVRAIVPYVSEVIVVEGFDPQQCSIDVLQKECLKYQSNVSIINIAQLNPLLYDRDCCVLVTGSLYLISRVRRLVR